MPRTTIRSDDITDAQVKTVDIADDAYLANKNIFINGAMLVSQRNTSVAAVTTNGYYTVDRMRLSCSSMGTWTIAQEILSSGNALADGFQRAFRMDCTTANATPAAANALAIQCKMEGYALQGLKKGTANAKSFTVSFWVKSNLTGNYNFFVKDRDNSRQAIQLYTINTADTWEKMSLTFTGDTTGVLGCDANSSLEFWWMLGSGTDYSSGTRPTGWEGGGVWANTGVGNVNLAASTANDWAITGVQFEIGDTATPFEHKSFGQELQACQRYFQIPYNWWAHSDAGTATSWKFVHDFPVQMRAAPTLAAVGTPTVNKMNANAAGPNSIATPGTANQYGFQLSFTTMATGSGSAAATNTPYSGFSGFTADAEL